MGARRFTDEQVRELRERAARGEADADLAVAFGAREEVIGALRTGARRPAAGGPITRRVPRVTRLQRDRIRRALARGETHAEIAAREGVSETTVWSLRHPRVTAREFRELLRDVEALRTEVRALRALV